MRDRTVEALDRLAQPTDIGSVRAAIEQTGEERATSAAAPVRTRRALLLLFDVLVGITTGTLRHDQSWWTRVTDCPVDETPDSWLDRLDCGTFRCAAGWLVHIRFPLARAALSPAVGRTRLASFVDIPAADIPDAVEGRHLDYTTAALLALDVRDSEQIGSISPVVQMFDGDNTVTALWRYASAATGGVVALPDEIADQARRLSARQPS